MKVRRPKDGRKEGRKMRWMNRNTEDRREGEIEGWKV